MNGGKSTFGLYKTDAPELVDTLKKMKEATLEELKEVLPEEVASNVYTYLKEI